MIYVTGDTHGPHDIRKLGAGPFPEGRDLTRDDFVVICGDFGLVWSDPPSGEDEWWLGWLEGKPWTTLFVDGNHENHDLLDAMPVEDWCGGRVHRVRPHVLHLMRGELFDLPDGDGTVRALTFGGASSHDIRWRTEGVSWWPQELPGLSDFLRAKESMARRGWRVDYVFTHDCPATFKDGLADVLGPHRDRNDRLNRFLGDIEASLNYRLWYFGHYHVDMRVAERAACLYDQVIRAGELPAR